MSIHDIENPLVKCFPAKMTSEIGSMGELDLMEPLSLSVDGKMIGPCFHAFSNEGAKNHQTQTPLVKRKTTPGKSSLRSMRGISLVQPLSESVNSGLAQVHHPKCHDGITQHLEPASEI